MAELLNSDEIQKQLINMTKGINLRPIMADVGAVMLLSIEDNIEEGGRYAPGDGAPGTPGAWTGGDQKFAPLGESTLKSKKRKGRDGGHILQDTGRMMAAMDLDLTDSSAQVTNNLVYFPHVTLGTKPGTIPHLEPRPVLVIQEEDIEEIGIIVSEFIERQLK